MTCSSSRILLSGGCKNGKSFLAQRLACDRRAPGAPLYYVATMRPADGEDNARIKRHVAERAGWGFVTLEQPVDCLALLQKADAQGSFLFDSVTALLANEMFVGGGEVSVSRAERAGARVALELTELCAALPHIVFVSDFIFSDGGMYDPLTECYRRALAACDRTLAAACDVVVEVAAGMTLAHRGEL